jgi:excisionase family DNA binding protein
MTGKKSPRKQQRKARPPRIVLTVREAADALGIGLNQAYEAVKAGHIPSIRWEKKILIPRAAFEQKFAGNA